MNQEVKKFLLGMLLSIPIVVTAAAMVLLRPFWRSEWGMPPFILLFWVTMSLIGGWGGRGKPYSLRFGLIIGSGFTLTGIAAVLAHSAYVGVGVFVALLYIGTKTKFFERRAEEPKAPPKQ